MIRRWLNERRFNKTVKPKLEGFLTSDNIPTSALESFLLALDVLPDKGLHQALDCFIYLIETDSTLTDRDKYIILSTFLTLLNNEKFV